MGENDAATVGPAGRVRVLHVPGGHGYVANVHDERVPGVEVVPEPVRSGAWAPSPALDATWVSENADTFDVLHLHFGFESRTPAQLEDLVQALRRGGKSLVLTVHDLENPHLRDQSAYDRLLDVLVPAADGLVTLTPGAAQQVRDRWERTPVVLPHPHLAPLGRIGAPRRLRSEPVVGLHLKSLRANLLPLPAVQNLADAVARVPGARLRLDVHEEALRADFPRHDADLTAWLSLAAAQDHVDLRVHGRFDDEELVDYLGELDVSVIAYGHGTHSGWLELCHDLGVPVLAGRTGFLAEQHPLQQVDFDDVESVRTGLQRALRGAPRATVEGRRAQRLRIAQEHRDLYRAVSARASARVVVPR